METGKRYPQVELPCALLHRKSQIRVCPTLPKEEILFSKTKVDKPETPGRHRQLRIVT